MLYRLALSAALLALTACGPQPAGDVGVSAEPVALFPDDPGRERVGALRYTGGVVLSSEDARFGGWSAMELSEDGARLLAISDSATWMTANLQFNADGHLTGLSDAALAPMLDANGQALTGESADAEGLAPLGEGRYAVSFERQHRIEAFDLGPDWSAIESATATARPGPPGADRLRNNAGMEALTTTADALWVGVEYPIMEGQPYTLWRFDLEAPDTPARAHAVALTPGFGLTALASQEDGALVLIERFYARDIGNRIRIGQISEAGLEAGETPTLLAELTPDMTVDNFEAAATAVINGETRLFILSDDNFNASQRSLLLSFAVEA